jgi:hypothetical protein
LKVNVDVGDVVRSFGGRIRLAKTDSVST